MSEKTLSELFDDIETFGTERDTGVLVSHEGRAYKGDYVRRATAGAIARMGTDVIAALRASLAQAEERVAKLEAGLRELVDAIDRQGAVGITGTEGEDAQNRVDDARDGACGLLRRTIAVSETRMPGKGRDNG